MRQIMVGSRQSALALVQTDWIIRQMKEHALHCGLDCEFIVKKFVTQGDRTLDKTLSKVGGKGLFVKEIEQALLTGEIDIAVHSMKDLPADLPEGLVIGAVPVREEPRDCLIIRNPHNYESLSVSGLEQLQLPAGARIGTSSLRRASQLLAVRPDLQIEPLRGNIDSRLKKLEGMELDAIILAAAGLHRMGWQNRISAYLQPEVCLPAVGQGALAVQCRESDSDLLALLEQLQHPATVAATTAERSVLRVLQGGCHAPIAAYAAAAGEDRADEGTAAQSEALADGHEVRIAMTAMVAVPDGSRVVRAAMSGSDPVKLGQQLAQQLIDQGAADILRQFGGDRHE